jgi:MFS family permease
MLAFVLASISGGFLNQKIGYYTALGITGACLMSMGAGLLTTLEVHTPQGRWIGYQILYGFGMGLCFQTPNLATQTVLPKPDVPMGIALMFFGQLLGAAIILSVADNVLVTQLQRKLAELPGFDPSAITSGGATSLLSTLSPDLLDTAIIVYNDALRTIFRIGLVFSCLAVLGTSAMEWKNILKQPEVKPGGPPEAESKPNAAATEEN